MKRYCIECDDFEEVELKKVKKIFRCKAWVYRGLDMISISEQNKRRCRLKNLVKGGDENIKTIVIKI